MGFPRVGERCGVDLTPTERGTLVRMEQIGFRDDQEAAYKGATYGWKGFFGGLERVIGELA